MFIGISVAKPTFYPSAAFAREQFETSLALGK